MAVGVCSTHSTGSYWKTQATVAAKRGLHDDGLRCPSSAELHARNNCNGLIKLLTKEYTVVLERGTQSLISLERFIAPGCTTADTASWESVSLMGERIRAKADRAKER